MIKRCILIFPQFENARVIDDIREKYDPNYKYVAPHITLVFPFESDISKEDMQQHIEKAAGNAKCFCLGLCNLLKVETGGFYLMLCVSEGRSKVKQLHEELYKGILAEYKPVWEGGFMPHMTVGQFETAAELDAAYDSLSDIHDEFSARICRVSCEIIGEKNESIIEFELPLQP